VDGADHVVRHVRGALHLDGLGAHRHVAVVAVEQVAARVGGVELLGVHVDDVHRARGRAPGDVPVGAEDDGWVGERGVAGHVVARAVQPDAEDIAGVEPLELRAVDQHGVRVGGLGLAGDPDVGCLRADVGPAVAAGPSRHLHARVAQLRRDARLPGAGLSGSGGGGRSGGGARAGDRRRRERVLGPDQLVEEGASLLRTVRRGQLCQHLGVGDLGRRVAVAVRHRPDPDHGDVVRGPPTRREPIVGELLRQELARVGGDGVEPLVHPRGVAVEDVPVLLGQRGDLLLDGVRAGAGAGVLVEGQVLSAEHLGDRALGGPPGHLHLEEPVLGDGVAEAAEQVVRRGGVDMGNAVVVANDGDSARPTGLVAGVAGLGLGRGAA
jgi:hypothetical protein